MYVCIYIYFTLLLIHIEWVLLTLNLKVLPNKCHLKCIKEGLVMSHTKMTTTTFTGRQLALFRIMKVVLHPYYSSVIESPTWTILRALSGQALQKYGYTRSVNVCTKVCT